jgi:hypothetical protein
MSEQTQHQIELERTFGLMDVADELRRQRRRVQEHVAGSDREAIKRHLLERYRAMGHEADPALIDEAIDRVLEQANRFRPPEPGFGLRVARLWVRRRRIFRILALPVVAIVGLTGLFAGVFNEAEKLWYGRYERAVELQVVGLAGEAERLRARLGDVERQAATAALEPARDVDLRGQLAAARERIAPVGTFLERYAPDGDPEPAVTRDNYSAVEARIGPMEAALDEARTAIAQADGLLAAVESAARALQLADRAEATAVGPDARARAAELADRARRLAQTGDTSALDGALSDAVADLDELIATLEQEYTLRIVAGVERDNSRAYLIVQAIDDAGRPVPRAIRSQETGSTRTVEEWAERVDRDLYESVGRDYEDDGVIDDDLFGRKLRGYLTVERLHEDLGQITDW